MHGQANIKFNMYLQSKVVQVVAEILDCHRLKNFDTMEGNFGIQNK